jgi:hypothetical protein
MVRIEQLVLTTGFTSAIHLDVWLLQVDVPARLAGSGRATCFCETTSSGAVFWCGHDGADREGGTASPHSSAQFRPSAKASVEKVRKMAIFSPLRVTEVPVLEH